MSEPKNLHSQRNLDDYCKLLEKLNVSNTKDRGEAQYKPILILSIIDLIAQGLITDNQIFISEELIINFKKYWNILANNSSYVGGIHYPFYHLRTDGFWHLVFKDTFTGKRPKTLNKLKDAVKYAYLDRELFALIQNPLTRQELIDSLVSHWFANDRQELLNLLSINQNFELESALTELDNLDSKVNFTLRKSAIRNSFFRKTVVHIYDYRCAFCQLKVSRTPNQNQNLLDGAHIKPFAEFFDSRIDNGISLCKNHHWAFDMGWFSVNDNYQILVTKDLDEDSPYTRAMKDFHGEALFLPKIERYLPRLEALQWHRENKFVK